MPKSDLLNHTVIKSHLTTLKNCPIKIFDELPSTNDYLLQYPGNAPWVFCLAEEQTEGRGRFGRVWHSPPRDNIYFSCRILLAQPSGALSLIVALALMAALKKWAPTGLMIKWPNDILFEGKKLAGILLETAGKIEGKTAVVIGIGLNVHLPPEVKALILRPVASLAEIAGTKPERNLIVAAMINALVEAIARFEKYGFADFMPLWQQYDFLWGKPLTLIEAGQPITGIARGVDAAGCLLLEAPSGKISAHTAGEVTLSHCLPQAVTVY